MQVLDARHMELFLEEGYLTKTWQYEEIGSNRIPTPSKAAVGGIFDLACLSSSSTESIITWTTYFYLFLSVFSCSINMMKFGQWMNSMLVSFFFKCL
jgi:hypothetical protein